MARRKDKKGRVLRKGESYRSSDNRYMYRYTDPFGKRKYIYDKDLNELREKEKEIEKLLASGVDYTRGLITVGELVRRYIELRQWRTSTEKVIKGAVNRILADPISSRMIKDVKIIDAKEFALKLSSGGLKRKSISTYFNILRPAFDLAIEDNAIAANPFSFSLASILRNDSETREAISYDEQERLIEFMSNDTRACKFVDDVVILLGTGLRVSELYGLTRGDIDFEVGTISVTKQLVKTNGVYHVTEPKSKKGNRVIPISDRVSFALRRVISNRKESGSEAIIDGCEGFLFVNQHG